MDSWTIQINEQRKNKNKWMNGRGKRKKHQTQTSKWILAFFAVSI